MWNWDIHKYIHIHTYFLSSTFDFEACKCTTHSKVNSIYLLLCHITQASFSVFPRQWQHISGFPTPSLLSILHTEAMLASQEHSCEHIHFLFKLPLASHLPRDRVQLSGLLDHRVFHARLLMVTCVFPHLLLSFCPSTRMFSHHPKSLSVLDSKPQFKPFSINSFQNPPLTSIPSWEKSPSQKPQPTLLLSPYTTCHLTGGHSSFCTHLSIQSVNIYLLTTYYMLCPERVMGTH